MARPLRIEYAGALYHVTARGNERKRIYFTKTDYGKFREYIEGAQEKYGCLLHAYVFMTNHLMASDNGERDTIPNSIQLIAGRTGQEYNQRKGRKGAFWEDRYHATAVAFDEHLFKCMVYIDMNMVRAGVVRHPAEWPFCGYNEIQTPRQRYSLIDYYRLIPLLQMKDIGELQESCRKRVEENLATRDQSRDSKWTESIAVGSKVFIEATIKRLGIKAKGRKIVGSNKSYELREPAVPYGGNFSPENGRLRLQNTYYWDDIV